MRTLCRAIASMAVGLSFACLAQAPDVFDFIPHGGRTLLAKVLSAKTPASEQKALVSEKRNREEWAKFVGEHRKTNPGLQSLTEKEARTLADYLSFNMPLPAASIPASPTQANWEKALPPDGRDLALNYCQGCHIITVVVTQNRSKDAWLGTMHKPSHIRIKLTEEQRDALATYLIVNAAIPIDDVPEDLRAGGASY